MSKYVCIHGHFYQPPRENPWLEVVELQDSAYPYHDWNERVTAESYAPNTASRILDSKGRIIDIVNNYSKISFDFGPTLLSWLERHDPDTYEAILEADRLSTERANGHGSAIAQVYNHMIMPLATRRDKYTQVIWGIKDFERRFGRFPEGMWLPETAADTETLEILGEAGIKFTILSPLQARSTRAYDERGQWHKVGGGRIDSTMPYTLTLPSGRTIHVFFYNGEIAHEVAFGDLLKDGERFAQRLLSVFNEGGERPQGPHRSSESDGNPQLSHIATDGETYGHHHYLGNMALAYCLHYIESNNFARVTNYAEYLELHPPTHGVEIYEGTSWSCAHGVERWRGDCGCSTRGGEGGGGWNQKWRGPLRGSMDWLSDKLHSLYEQEASRHLRDHWEARNAYVEVVLDRSRDNVERFLAEHTLGELSREEETRVLRLLEMQRNAMLMHTSCGWFFDEISGIETTQVLRYASRAIQLGEELSGSSLEPEYLGKLAEAPSNIPEYENGARIYERLVRPAGVTLLRVGAHYALSSLFENYPDDAGIYCYTAHSQAYDRTEAGRLELAVGRSLISSNLTWGEAMVSFAVLNLGDHNLLGGVREYLDEEAFPVMKNAIKEAFDKSDIPEVIRLMDEHFGTHNYSLRDLFRDEQRKILEQMFESTLEEVESSYRQIFENNYHLLNLIQEIQVGMPIPKPLLVAAESVINADLRRVIEADEPDLGRFEKLIGEVKKYSIKLDGSGLGLTAGAKIETLMEGLSRKPGDLCLLEEIESFLRLLMSLPLDLNLWKAQNLYFLIGKSHFEEMKAIEGADERARRWIDVFNRLGQYLRVKVSP